jgi:hypothetical protein
MKTQNQIICEYVSRHPLCLTSDVAAHIGEATDYTAKLMNQLETSDHLRVPTKQGRRNQWIVGANTRFRPGAGNFYGKGNGGGKYYPTNGNIDRKRVVTVAATAEDALALIANGFSKMKVF